MNYTASSTYKKNSEANNKVKDLIRQRGVRDVRGYVGHRGTGVRCRRRVFRFSGGRDNRTMLWKHLKSAARTWMVPTENSVTAGLSMRRRGSETLRTEEESGRSTHENLSAERLHSSSHK